MPRIFISYSHDCLAHVEAVNGLVHRLRDRGIDVRIDRDQPTPPENWSAWTREEIRNADFVLAVCTATYFRLAERWQDPRWAHLNHHQTNASTTGAVWEDCIWIENFYENSLLNARFVPLLFHSASVDNIPGPLRSMASYRIPRDEDVLRRRLLKEQNSVHRIDVSSVDEFLETVSPTHDRWRHGPWFFRGVKTASWSLTPSLFRMPWDMFESTGGYHGTYLHSHMSHHARGETSFTEDDRSRRESLAYRAVEFRALCDFLYAANRNGFSIPDFDYWWMNAMTDPDVVRALNSLDEAWPLARTIVQLAYAQHYRVRTRLLDWSHSPYTASWFAVSDVIDALYRHTKGTSALTYSQPDDARFCVWAINAGAAHHFRTEGASLEIIQTAYHLNTRVAAQKGVFTLLRAAGGSTSGETERLDHDKFIQRMVRTDDPALIKIVAPHRIAPALLEALFRHGTTRATVYPEIENVEIARHDMVAAEVVKDLLWLKDPEANYIPGGASPVPFYLTKETQQTVETCRKANESTLATVVRLFQQGLSDELRKTAARETAAKKIAAKKTAAKKTAAKKTQKPVQPRSRR